ncbi:MAG: hypothetical protein V1891_03235 [bacterium]
MRKLTVLLLLVCAIIIGAPKISKALVDPWGDVGSTPTENMLKTTTGLGDTDPRTMIASIIKLVLGFLGIIAVVIILVGGFKWMTAGGNDDQVGEAKKWIYSGVVGLLIVLASYALANFVLTQLIGVTTG